MKYKIGDIIAYDLNPNWEVKIISYDLYSYTLELLKDIPVVWTKKGYIYENTIIFVDARYYKIGEANIEIKTESDYYEWLAKR